MKMGERRTNLNFSVVVLAAGNSIRMGVPKFSLRFNSKHSFLEHIAHEYHDLGCKEIIIVINESGNSLIKENVPDFPENVKIIVNKHPEWDRFYSVKTGLQSLSKNLPVFIVNVDNPFVNSEVAYALLNEKINADYVHPTYMGKGGHPVLLFQKIIMDIVNEKQNQLNFREYLNKYSKKTVEVDDENSLININTQEEYKHYF
jgi:molybdenum cofactor cytidylyltransferase